MKACTDWSINESLLELACHCNWDKPKSGTAYDQKLWPLFPFLPHMRTANLHFISNTALAALRTSSVKQHPET